MLSMGTKNHRRWKHIGLSNGPNCATCWMITVAYYPCKVILSRSESEAGGPAEIALLLLGWFNMHEDVLNPGDFLN